jgi:hypothetical protein
VDEIRPNIFEALKRAYIKRGIVPRSYHSKGAQPPAEAKSENITASETKSASSPAPDGSEKTTEKPGLKKNGSEAKTAKGPESLTELTQNASEVLYEATTIFPFTPFPDTITVDREKITIANRFFWRTANITSTPISEVMSAESNVGPFFGSLHLTFRFFTDNTRTISFLWRHDASNLQKLIHGFIIAHRREVDTSRVPMGELKAMLMELGQGVSD